MHGAYNVKQILNMSFSFSISVCPSIYPPVYHFLCLPTITRNPKDFFNEIIYRRVFLVVIDIFQFWLLLKNSSDHLLLRGDIYSRILSVSDQWLIMMQRKLLGKEVTEEINFFLSTPIFEVH